MAGIRLEGADALGEEGRAEADALVEEVRSADWVGENAPKVAEWLNRAGALAFGWCDSKMEGCMELPRDADGAPVAPGACVAWAEPGADGSLDRFEVVAVSQSELMLKPWGSGAAFPEGMCPADSTRLAEPLSAGWVVGRLLDMVGDADQARLAEWLGDAVDRLAGAAPPAPLD